jgi:hypothetical protein
MKHIVERYIYAVTKRLPENMRAEVKEELHANITDMLSKNPTDEEIDKVLHELGHPRELAKNYRGEERYVISPLFFDDYLQVLKIVTIILLAVSLTFGTFDAIIHVEASTVFLMIAEVIGKILSNVFGAFIHAFAWVTLIFWGIDYAARQKKLPDWKLSDLPDLPTPQTTKISKVESLLGLILGTAFSAIFIIFLTRYIHLIGIYENGEMVAQIFNKQVTDRFIVFFIISAVIGIAVNLLKLHHGEWKIHLAILYTAHEVLSTVLFLIFIRSEGLMLNEALVKIGSYVDLTVSEVQANIDKGIVGITVFICIVVGIDLITTWVKTLKRSKA